MTTTRLRTPERQSRLAPPGTWRRRAGTLLLVGGVLLTAATPLEYVVLGPGAPNAVFWLFVVLFALSLLFLPAGAAVLALGGTRETHASRARGGIVGTSGVGRAALLVYGGAWLVSQVAYLGYKYFVVASTLNYLLVTVSTVFLFAGFAAGIVAGVVVVGRRVVRGRARWGILVSIAVSAATGAVSSAMPDSLALLTITETISALGQVYFAIAVLFAREW